MRRHPRNIDPMNALHYELLTKGIFALGNEICCRDIVIVRSDGDSVGSPHQHRPFHSSSLLNGHFAPLRECVCKLRLISSS
jgi:hypothetical protein